MSRVWTASTQTSCAAGRTVYTSRTVLLAKTNQTVPGTDPFGVKGRALLAVLPLPPMLAWQREDGLSQLEALNRQIKRIDVYLRGLAREQPAVPRLTAIPSIGIFSALLILADIGEIQRFPSASRSAPS